MCVHLLVYLVTVLLPVSQSPQCTSPVSRFPRRGPNGERCPFAEPCCTDLSRSYWKSSPDNYLSLTSPCKWAPPPLSSYSSRATYGQTSPFPEPYFTYLFTQRKKRISCQAYRSHSLQEPSVNQTSPWTFQEPLGHDSSLSWTEK